jgi:hypothetical protein
LAKVRTPAPQSLHCRLCSRFVPGRFSRPRGAVASRLRRVRPRELRWLLPTDQDKSVIELSRCRSISGGSPGRRLPHQACGAQAGVTARYRAAALSQDLSRTPCRTNNVQNADLRHGRKS